MKERIAIAVSAGICLLAGILMGRLTAPELTFDAPRPDAGAPPAVEEDRLRERDRTIGALEARIRELEAEAGARPAAAPPPAGDAPLSMSPVFSAEALQNAADNLLANDAFQGILEQGWKEGLRRMVDQQYGDLFGLLDLDDDKKDALRDLLMRAMSEGTEPMVPWLRAGDGQEFDATDLEEQIRQLLGPSGFAEYEQFKETRHARESARWFQHYLVQTGEPLDRDQREKLVASMHRHVGPIEDRTGNMESTWVSALQGNPVSEELSVSLDEVETAYQAVLDDAEAFLHEDQVTDLETYLNQQIRQREFQATMADRVFQHMNTQDAEPAPAVP